MPYLASGVSQPSCDNRPSFSMTRNVESTRSVCYNSNFMCALRFSNDALVTRYRWAR